jgi:hypothetical protein
MASMAFALPLKMSSDEARKAAAELTGPHGQKFTDRHRSHGFTAVKMWHQRQPTEQVVVYLEADNLEQAINNFANSSHQDDQTSHRLFEQLTGQRPGKHGGSQAELVIDWHRDGGHRKK